MVKLASARESRIYGPRLSRSRSEYFNGGLYVLATILLLGGFTAQFSSEPKSGLVLMLIALGLIAIVNLHDFLAHLAGIDYRFEIVRFDPQLAYVEFGVPFILAVGTLLFFLGILFLFLEAERGYEDMKLEHYALNLLVAGAVIWMIGCTFNACQVYEQADAYVQLMQQSVYIPFLLGSFLFLVGACLNSKAQIGHIHHGWHLLGEMFIWFGIVGSILLFIGGVANVAKIYKMQQVHNHALRLRLERLRGGAHSLLIQIREGGGSSGAHGHEPLLLANEETRRMFVKGPIVEEGEGQKGKFNVGPTPYKDSLLSNT